jgi:acyl-homoserine-lactone acylase
MGMASNDLRVLFGQRHRLGQHGRDAPHHAAKQQQDQPLDMRARFGLATVSAALAGGGRMSLQDLQSMVMNNRVHLADLVLDDLLTLCPGQVALGAACGELSRWDRSANADAGVGLGYFEALAGPLQSLPAQAWREPFDPARPVSTPRGLNAGDPEVAVALGQALQGAVAQVDASAQWANGRLWGDIQRATVGGQSLAMHGGSGELGIYNAIYSVPSANGRQRIVMAGSSYVQAVSFGATGPQAMALLSYSQSGDPGSPHAADQTALFARKQWIKQAFTAQEIAADPAYRQWTLSE